MLAASQEEIEVMWRALIELVVEALEKCLRDGALAPGEGLVGLEAALKRRGFHDKKTS